MKIGSPGFFLRAFILFLSFGPVYPLTESLPFKASFERIGPFGGQVRALLVDRGNPGIVYLGTSGGVLYRSLDGGNTWNLIFPGIARRGLVIDTLVQHPARPDRLFIGAWDLHSEGGGLFESLDGGESWREVRLPRSSPAIRDMAICAGNADHMLVGTPDDAYLSQDGGKTWHSLHTRPNEFPKIESVAIDPENPSVLFLGTWRLPYRSEDAGKTWRRIETGMLLDSDVFSICPDPANTGVFYASACTGIYRSTNRGSNWVRLPVLPNRFGVRAQLVSIDTTDSRRLYGATTEGLFVSENAGQSWRRLTLRSLTVNAVQVDPANSKRILIGTENEGVLRSEDGGRTWNPSNFGFVYRQVSRILPNMQVPGLFVARVAPDAATGGFMEYDRHEDRWSSLPCNLDGNTRLYSCLPLPRDGGYLLGTSKGIYRREKSPGSWMKIPGAIGNLAVFDLQLDPRSSEILAGTSDGVYRGSVHLLDFRKLSETGLNRNVFCIGTSPGNADHIYAGSVLGIIRSFDRGKTWNAASLGLPLRAVVQSLAICPSESGHVFAGTSMGLFETRDEGNSWQRASDGRLSVDVPSVVFLDPTGQKVMAADNSQGGVFISLDGGRKWNKVMAPDFESPVCWIAQDPGRPLEIYLATRSEGVYRLVLTGTKPALSSR